MSVDYVLDQYVGQINTIAASTLLLGARGVVNDETVQAGSQLATKNSGGVIGVMVCRKDGATAGLKGGYGVKFKAGLEGIAVDALSAVAGECDGVVDPGITTDLADGDTFLLFQTGPFAVYSSAAFAVGEGIKPAAAGKFAPLVGNEAGTGRAIESASGADELKRGYHNLGINAKGGLLA